ncbi:hypothetical protein Scep_016916 [Stephania cephalantha]|uniref:Uncharacterized protein n=1 Tax=Stephania cephalantha TaxID=152367 RepID=A0AAP0NTS0_9MAGN
MGSSREMFGWGSPIHGFLSFERGMFGEVVVMGSSRLLTYHAISNATSASQRLETQLKDGMDEDIVKEEVRIITDFINSWGYETISDLQDYMEQLFADMMNKFLVQFRNAIHRELTECYLEEYEENVRMALTLIQLARKLRLNLHMRINN